MLLNLDQELQEFQQVGLAAAFLAVDFTPAVGVELDPLSHQLNVATCLWIVWLQFQAVSERGDGPLELVENLLPFLGHNCGGLFSRELTGFFGRQCSRL